jgi:RsiW-degrading membrane proteinase PrsW (M82 family)
MINGSSPLLWVAVFGSLAFVWTLPILIALVRRTEQTWLVIVLALVGGATCVGWPAAIIAAFMLPKREPAVTYVPHPPSRRPLPYPDIPLNDLERK